MKSTLLATMLMATLAVIGSSEASPAVVPAFVDASAAPTTTARFQGLRVFTDLLAGTATQASFAQCVTLRGKANRFFNRECFGQTSS